MSVLRCVNFLINLTLSTVRDSEIPFSAFIALSLTPLKRLVSIRDSLRQQNERRQTTLH